jgi:hypothetical protein
MGERVCECFFLFLGGPWVAFFGCLGYFLFFICFWFKIWFRVETDHLKLYFFILKMIPNHDIKKNSRVKILKFEEYFT